MLNHRDQMDYLRSADRGPTISRARDMTVVRSVLALRAAWESVSPRWAVSFERFQQILEGWEVHEVSVNGKPVGAILINGPEIHACINEGHGCWIRKEQLRLLNSVIEKHGYAETHASTEAGEQFVKRLGFEQHGKAFRRTAKWALKR